MRTEWIEYEGGEGRQKFFGDVEHKLSSRAQFTLVILVLDFGQDTATLRNYEQCLKKPRYAVRTSRLIVSVKTSSSV